MFTSGMRADTVSHAKKGHHQRDQKSRQHSNVCHSILSLLLLLLGALQVKYKTGKWDNYAFSGLTASCETSYPVVATCSCLCCARWWRQALLACFCPKTQAAQEVDQLAPFLSIFLSVPLSVNNRKPLSTMAPPFSEQCNWSCVRAATFFFALIAQ